MNQFFYPAPLDRDFIVQAIAHLRSEWQESSEDSLVDVQASVGYLLADLVAALGLTPEEKVSALGEELASEVADTLQFA